MENNTGYYFVSPGICGADGLAVCQRRRRFGCRIRAISDHSDRKQSVNSLISNKSAVQNGAVLSGNGIL